MIYQRGDKTFTGQVRVNQDLSTEVLNVDGLVVKKELYSQLWEITIHRIRRAFEDTQGQNTFRYGETDDTGAAELLVGGESKGNSYKVATMKCVMFIAISMALSSPSTLLAAMTQERAICLTVMILFTMILKPENFKVEQIILRIITKKWGLITFLPVVLSKLKSKDRQQPKYLIFLKFSYYQLNN